MCGIAGIVASNAMNYTKLIEKMRKTLSHRGPDEDGECFFFDAAFAHTRLSIIDITSGKQPMLSDDKTLCIVLNGEIYGYKSIKEKLINKYKFNNNSDTEVVLNLYIDKGDSFVDELPGMFSFAIWDTKKKNCFVLEIDLEKNLFIMQ